MKTTIPHAEKAFDKGYYFWINRLAESLKAGPLCARHFRTFGELTALLGAQPLFYSQTFEDGLGFIDPQQPRRLAFYRRCHRRHYQPCAVGIAADADHFFYQEIPFPVFFNFGHVTFQHEDRGDLKLEDTDLIGVTGLALLFSKVLKEIPAAQRRLMDPEGLPFFLPDDHGLFFCHARAMLPGQNEGYISLLRAREGGECRVADPRLSWKPEINVFINSYVAYKNLYKGMDYIRSDHLKDVIGHEFDNIFYSPGMTDALGAFWRDFSFPLMAAENSRLVRMKDTPAVRFHREGERLVPHLEERVKYLLGKSFWQPVFQSRPAREPIILKPRPVPQLPCMGDERTHFPCAGPSLPGLGAPLRPSPAMPFLLKTEGFGLGAKS